MANECKMGDEEFLLKLLDGLSDGNGRVIFASTNSIEKINTKYLKPCRFGFTSFILFV